MKKMSKAQKILLVVLTLVLLGGTAGVYFFHINPLLDEQAKLEKSYQNEMKVLDALQAQQAEDEGIDYEVQATELQRQLPLQPFIEQVFTIFNDAERSSNSKILNYGISQLEDVSIVNMEGIKGISFDLSVEAPTYNGLITFIGHLEDSDRMMSINRVAFSGGEGALQFELNVSAYYTEGFENLKEYEPSITIPGPSNKTNPIR